jgi:hypothetical protein
MITSTPGDSPITLRPEDKQHPKALRYLNSEMEPNPYNEPPPPQPKAKFFNVAGYKVAINTLSGIYPYFTVEARQRMKNKMSLNIVITGEAGVSKTYTGAMICKLLNPRFSLEETVMTFKEYMEAILKKGKTNVPILFDEPQYALDKRDWYNDVNKALIKTITSQRFRRRPLVIPIINQSLLDLNLRKYLLNYHIVRGKGVVYRMTASQVEDKIYRRRICTLQYGLMDNNLCAKDSCLGCRVLHKKNGEDYLCNLWRSTYERKKLELVNQHDEESMEEVNKMEMKNLTDADFIGIVSPEITKAIMTRIIYKGKPNEQTQTVIEPTMLSNLIEEKTGVTLGVVRCLRLRRQLELKFPLFSRTNKE